MNGDACGGFGKARPGLESQRHLIGALESQQGGQLALECRTFAGASQERERPILLVINRSMSLSPLTTAKVSKNGRRARVRARWSTAATLLTSALPPMARAMLDADPELRAELKQKLIADQAFAGDCSGPTRRRRSTPSCTASGRSSAASTGSPGAGRPHSGPCGKGLPGVV